MKLMKKNLKEKIVTNGSDFEGIDKNTCPNGK